MSVLEKKAGLSQFNRWLILIVIVFACLAATRYDQQILSWVSGWFQTPIELGVEIKVHPLWPRDRHGMMIITNLTEHPLKIQNVRINRRKDTACSFNPNGEKPPDEAPPLQPGGNIWAVTPALVMGGCGSIFNVEIATDKGTVSLNFNWDRNR